MSVARIIFTTLTFIFIAGSIYSFHQKWDEREDASAIKTRKMFTASSLSNEMFKFNKKVSIKFDFSAEIVEHAFEGYLFFNWQNHNLATVGFWMPGHESDLLVKAHFNDSFSLRCIEFPKYLSERETDYALLINNLILDYAYKTFRDDNGKYAAKLSSEKNAQGHKKITKVKSDYQKSAKVNLKVNKSLHEILLTEKLVEARGQESLEINFNDKNASTTTSYTLASVTSADASKPDFNRKREFGKCRNDFIPSSNAITNLTESEFKSELISLTVSERSGRQDSARKILKALRSNPDYLKIFIENAHTVFENKQQAALMVGILGNLGTPEAQKELLGLFKNRPMQNLILNALALTESPLSSESREFLKNQIDHGDANLPEGAAYALGTSIQNDPESSESKNDLDHLVNALEAAGTTREKMIYLDALGNSGSVDAFPAFQKYAHSDDELLREKAIQGLRFIQNAEKEIIYKMALNDPSSRVRQAAEEGLKL